jgi:hypothetical protein
MTTQPQVDPTTQVDISSTAWVFEATNGYLMIMPHPQDIGILYFLESEDVAYHEVNVTWNEEYCIYNWRSETLDREGSFEYNPPSRWILFDDCRFTRSNRQIGESIKVLFTIF